MGALEPTSSLPPELPPTGRPFNPVEAAIGVITRPVPAMQEIAAARPWLIALLIFTAIALLNGLASLTARPPTAEQLAALVDLLGPEVGRAVEASATTPPSPVPIILQAVLLWPLLLLIATGILYLLARLFGGTGPFDALLATTAFAWVPRLLFAPLTALLNLGGPALGLLTLLLNVGFYIWTIVLIIIGIRESMRVSTGRAVATCGIPLGGCLLLICVLSIAAFGLLIAAFSGASGR